MHIRSRRHDPGRRSRRLTARRGQFIAWSIGIAVAVAACGPSPATTRGQAANAPVSGSGPMALPGSSPERGGSSRTASGQLDESTTLGQGPASSPGSTSAPGSREHGHSDGGTHAQVHAYAQAGTGGHPQQVSSGRSPAPASGTCRSAAAPSTCPRISPLPTLQTLTADQDIIVMDPTRADGAPRSQRRRLERRQPLHRQRPDADRRCPSPPPSPSPAMAHNDALAVLMPDGQTVIQAQPFARCTPAGPATALALAPADNLYTNGILGAHGGSGLSSLGGTLRLNELVPGGADPSRAQGQPRRGRRSLSEPRVSLARDPA